MALYWRKKRARVAGAVALACLALAVTAVLESTNHAVASPVASGDDWELDFQPGPLRLYVDPNDGQTYWYFIYTVANRTDRDRMWAPRLEVFTDGGKILRSGRNVPSRVSRR